MSNPALNLLMVRQEALIDALDSRDADRIMDASNSLKEAVELFRDLDAIRDNNGMREMLGEALRQNEASRIRTNCLMAWTRQRIDRLAELRGSHNGTYRPNL